MSNLFYIDNVTIFRDLTTIISGNSIHDLYSPTYATGIYIENVDTAIIRDNKISKIRSPIASVGILSYNCNLVNLSFNTISRTATGISLTATRYSNIYNLTIHECDVCVDTAANGIYKNIVFSEYPQYKKYANGIGFYIQPATTIDIDYFLYYGLGTVFTGGGTYTTGSNIWNKKPIYWHEEIDDLTPDYIDFMVKSGISEPRLYPDPSIGGIQSKITTEISADRKYHYELLDNSFWDIENDQSGEVSLIKCFQSRILAANELAEHQVERDYCIKFMDSTESFAELYPMHAHYLSPSKSKKSIIDMWLSGQNAATLPSYNRGIGGYNLLSSFFKRCMFYDDCWIIDISYVDYDNYLLGYEDLKYGIVIDVLGISTISTEASSECYNNVMNTIADIAPVRWNVHNEVQPHNYFTFANFYNNFEECILNNMIYNEDFQISMYNISSSGVILTPVLLVTGLGASGASGAVELSTFDRINSETVSRDMYYRIGDDPGVLTNWKYIQHPIGEILVIDGKTYIQFKIEVRNVLRQIDYEFVALELRKTTYTTYASGENLGDYYPELGG
jgi:hypothetical protein